MVGFEGERTDLVKWVKKKKKKDMEETGHLKQTLRKEQATISYISPMLYNLFIRFCLSLSCLSEIIFKNEPSSTLLLYHKMRTESNTKVTLL